jgi:hypothetical protein
MLESNNTIFYNRCVDDILIIFEGHKIRAEEISNYMYNIHKHFEFKLTCEKNGEIIIFDLLITRNKDKLANYIF